MKTSMTCLLLIVFAWVSVSSAATILDVSFGDTTGGLTLAPDVGSGPTATTGEFITVADTNDVFGAGAANGVLQVRKTGSNGSGRYTPTSNAQWGSVSFDVYEFGNTTSYLQITLKGPDQEIRFENGDVSRGVATANDVYDVGEAFHVDILFNTDESSAKTSDGITVNASRLELYINGTWVSGKSLGTKSNFWRFDPKTPAGTSGFLLDNVQAFGSEFNVIPEPATALLLGLGGLLFAHVAVRAVGSKPTDCYPWALRMEMHAMSIRRAFTLVELLVVVAIIALLISILLPALNKARAVAQATVCTANIRQSGMAASMYGSENEQWFKLSSKPGSKYSPWGSIYSWGYLLAQQDYVVRMPGSGDDPANHFYACPKSKPNTNNTATEHLRYNAYGANDRCFYRDQDEQGGYRKTGGLTLCNFSKMAQPAEFLLLADSIPGYNSQRNWAIIVQYAGIGGGLFWGVHSESNANAFFADGHAEFASESLFQQVYRDAARIGQ